MVWALLNGIIALVVGLVLKRIRGNGSSGSRVEAGVILRSLAAAAYRRFGQTYYGAFVVAGFITWYIVAGQATHFAG